MKVPAKYRGTGLHVWCKKCRTTITAKPCKHDEENHCYYSIVWNPIAGRSNKKQLPYDVRDPEEAYDLHREREKELKRTNFGIQKPSPSLLPKQILHDCENFYLDWLSNDPRIVRKSEIKTRSPKYIQETTKRIKTFNDVLRSHGVKPAHVHVEILPEWADWFFDYLTEKGYANKTFNHYIGALSGFYEFCIEKGLAQNNYFKTITKRKARKDNRMIDDEELALLFKVIKPIYAKGINGRNHYHPDLIKAIYLAMFTGGRMEEVFTLKGENKQGNFWIIRKSKESNKEEEAWSTSEDSEFREEFITEDCQAFISQFGEPAPGDYWIEPGRENRSALADRYSRAFTHFWNHSENEGQKNFKHLRKTFFTKKALIMQELGEYLPSHKNADTLRGHYIYHKAIIEEKMAGKKMYGI